MGFYPPGAGIINSRIPKASPAVEAPANPAVEPAPIAQPNLRQVLQPTFSVQQQVPPSGAGIIGSAQTSAPAPTPAPPPRGTWNADGYDTRAVVPGNTGVVPPGLNATNAPGGLPDVGTVEGRTARGLMPGQWGDASKTPLVDGLGGVGGTAYTRDQWWQQYGAGVEAANAPAIAAGAGPTPAPGIVGSQMATPMPKASPGNALPNIVQAFADLNFSGSNVPAAAAEARRRMAQNGWSVDQVAAAYGYTPDQIRAVLNQAPQPDYGAIRRTLDSLNFGGDAIPGSAAEALRLMAQNGWTVDDIVQAYADRGYTAAEIQAVLAKAGNGNGRPPGQGPGSGIISSYQSQAAQLGDPTKWEVTDEQTVEGRINRLTDPNSALQSVARARAKDEAAGRGLLNSAMAVTAGELAGYEAALPIAQADAATFAKAAGYNADMGNQFKVRNVDSRNQYGLQGMQNDLQRELAMINRDTQVQITRLQADLQNQANAIANENKNLLETNAQAAGAFNTAMSAINNIQNNANLDANAKTQAIANVWHDLQIQLTMMGQLMGMDLTANLNFAGYPGFNEQGQWVGFGGAPAPGPAPAPAANNSGADLQP